MTTKTACARDRQFASQFVPRAWVYTNEKGKIKMRDSVETKLTASEDDEDAESEQDEDLIAGERDKGRRGRETPEITASRGMEVSSSLSKLKQKSREKKKENRRVEFMQKIIEEQKLLLMDEQARSNQFEQQVKLLQKSVKLLEKECESLSAKMSDMFEKNAEKAHLNERIRQAEVAAMNSARETKRVVEENRESHHVIREQNKRISKLEKRLEEQVRKLEVSKKANELLRAGKNDNIDAKAKSSKNPPHPPPPTKQLAPEEIDWEAAYREIDELREAKRKSAG
jgi:hypothetical protein